MDIKMKWFYRLGFLLLLFVVLYVFFLLKEYWQPALGVLLRAASPFFFGALIAYLLHPLVKRLHEHGLQKWLSVLIIYILFFGGIGTAIYKGIPVFVRQLKDLSENVPLFFRQYESWIDRMEAQTEDWPIAVRNHLEEGIGRVNIAVEQFMERVLNFLLWLLDKFFIILLIPFITFYMIKDTDNLSGWFWQAVPSQWRTEIKAFLAHVDRTLGSYLRGQLLVCSLVGALTAFFFWLAKIKYPLILGMTIGITNVIPYFGPIIGAIPAAIIAATGSLKKVLFVIVIVFGLQFVEGNILSPIIVGKSMKMHPLLIIFSLLIGGEFGGIIGMIVAVPAFAVMRTAFSHFSRHLRKESI